MLLHLGGDTTIPLEKLVMVLNAAGMQPRTRAYIDLAVRERRYEPCAGRPKSYAVVLERGREIVHASAIASATLEKRWRDEILHRALFEAAVLTTEPRDTI